ncbi:MAG TPA: GntR family transcriptional regulator [Actinomycetota bacterium]|nr:GntR family transcriptional regulator [Actinomycetota bacterium]
MPATSESERPLDRLQLRYQHVKEQLAGEIERGRRRAGSRMPPERALAEHFGVSRVTLRRALDELARAGVVARSGTGWVVASTAIGEPPNMLMSFSEMAASRGLQPGGRVLERHARPATIEEAEAFGLAPGAPLFELERLRSMDDVPILVDRTRVPLSLAPGLDELDLEETSLYEVLEERFGMRPARARFTVDAIAADERRAALLGLEPGQPLLRCQQQTEDETGRQIELCEMVYRGDRYRFRATLLRGG